MRRTDFHIRYQPVQHIFDGRQFLHFVMNEENLAAALELIMDDALDFHLVEIHNFGLDGNAVGRRGLDDGQIPGSQQRKLEGTGNRSGRQRQGIHAHLHLTQFFFGTDTEFLFLVNHQQTQILELELFAQQFVRTDDYVDFPRFQILPDGIDFLGSAQTGDKLDAARKVLQPADKGIVML